MTPYCDCFFLIKTFDHSIIGMNHLLQHSCCDPLVSASSVGVESEECLLFFSLFVESFRQSSHSLMPPVMLCVFS